MSLTVTISVIESVDLNPPAGSLEDDLRRFLASAGSFDAVGHRVVHGGPLFTRPVVIDSRVRAELDEVNDLAPLHNPPALAAIDALSRLSPNVPAVACLDTTFPTLHSNPPPRVTHSRQHGWEARGLRRYGFHGLSCEWSAGRAATLLERPAGSLRLVICHLGGGASVTATANGHSVDTSMGFTPTEGLVMATRPGDVDPGALVWLTMHGVAPQELADALERRSGLYALSGGDTGDMRELLQHRAHGDNAAMLAIDVYVHRLRAKIAAMTAATDGADALIFTAGVGDHGSNPG